MITVISAARKQNLAHPVAKDYIIHVYKMVLFVWLISMNNFWGLKSSGLISALPPSRPRSRPLDERTALAVLGFPFVVTVALFDRCHFVLEASPRLRLMIGREQQERPAVAQRETHNHIYLYYTLYYWEFTEIIFILNVMTGANLTSIHREVVVRYSVW
jgi:hypothetical protein